MVQAGLHEIAVMMQGMEAHVSRLELAKLPASADITTAGQTKHPGSARLGQDHGHVAGKSMAPRSRRGHGC